MSIPPKAPPLFVPTLTEVVQGPDALPAQEPLVQPAPSHDASAAVHALSARSVGKEGEDIEGAEFFQAPSSQSKPLPQDLEEHMLHRVMQRVDVLLDRRLREAMALVLQEQTPVVLQRLREEIELVVLQTVHEAVADELSSGTPAKPAG